MNYGDKNNVNLNMNIYEYVIEIYMNPYNDKLLI